MTYEDAIKRFEYYYGKALNSPYVKKKVAWALFQTWKEADNDE